MPGRSLVVVAVDAGLLVEELHVAVEAVAAQIHEPAAALEDPGLDAVVHLPRPVFGMRADDQHAVGVEIELAEVELRLGVVVVRRIRSRSSQARSRHSAGARWQAARPAIGSVGCTCSGTWLIGSGRSNESGAYSVVS